MEFSGRAVERLGKSGLWPGRSGEPVGALSEALVERAREARDVIGQTRNHAEAALLMFVRGRHALEPAKRRDAYRSFLESTERILRRSKGSGIIGAEEVADRLVDSTRRGRVSRAYLDRLKRSPRSQRTAEPDSWRLHRFYTDLALILSAGAPISSRSLGETLDTAGVSAATREVVPGHGPLVPELPLENIKAVLQELSLNGIWRIVRTADDEEFETAREDVAAFVQFSRAFVPYAQAELAAPEAFGFRAIAELAERGAALAVPGVILVRRLFPAGIAEWRAVMADATPRFALFIETNSGVSSLDMTAQSK